METKELIEISHQNKRLFENMKNYKNICSISLLVVSVTTLGAGIYNAKKTKKGEMERLNNIIIAGIGAIGVGISLYYMTKR